MLKQEFTFTDFDNNVVTEVLWFNLTRDEMMENLEIQKEFEELDARFSTLDPKADASLEDKREMVRAIKKLMKLSYGVRDGNRFKKSEEIWDAFVEGPAYDGFLWYLFDKEENLFNFIRGIAPEALRASFDQEMAKIRSQVPVAPGGNIFENAEANEKDDALPIMIPLRDCTCGASEFDGATHKADCAIWG